MRRSRWVIHLLLFATLVFHTIPGLTQEISDDELLSISLEDLLNVKIKGATKTEISVSKSPNSVTVITYGQIQESGARTLPDLLRLVPGVNVRWNPMMQTIDMRGFGESPFTSRVLLLIDGVPYNSWNKGGFPQQPGFDFFVLQNVKQIEVIRGPSSSLYGENAYWGVINIVTLSGEDVNGVRLEAYAGERETRSASAIYGKGFENGSLLVSAKLLQSQFPTEFWFKDNDSKVRGSDIFLKGKYKAFELSYYRHNDDLDGFEQQIGPLGVFRSADKIEQTVDIVSLKSEHVMQEKGVRLSGEVSFARRSGMHCGSCHALPQNEHFSEKENHGYQLIGDFLMEMMAIPNNNLLVGIEGRRVDSEKHGDRALLQIDPATGESTVRAYNKFALYLQDRLSISKDRVEITGGLRYDSQTSPDLFGARISPRIAAVYTPTDRMTARASWNLAFHFPDFDQLYLNTWFLNTVQNDSATVRTEFAPNPALQPERIQGFDLGLDYRITSRLAAKIDIYRSYLKNFIIIAANSSASPSTIGYQNHPDDAITWGGELELRWDIIPGIRGFANYAYQDYIQDGNLTDSVGKQFEFVYAPKHKINVGGYWGPFSGVRGAIELSWRDHFMAPGYWNSIVTRGAETGTAELEGYTYLNFKASYDFPFHFGKVARPLRLNFVVRNILDKTPSETLLPVNSQMAGREFFAGLEYRFGL